MSSRFSHVTQWRLDASILPGEAEARKPKPLAIEGQAQEQRMNDQREQ